MKKTIEINYCDRCGEEFQRRNCFIIEDMSFMASGYSDSGSGGAQNKGLEFCTKCSHEFNNWLYSRKHAES